MLFSTICAQLLNNTITIEGASAELTRQAYYDQYVNWINTGQFVPIVYLNITDSQLSMSNTPEINFTVDDITTKSDWIVINRTN